MRLKKRLYPARLKSIHANAEKYLMPAHKTLSVKNMDREGNELRIGDRVGFVMRGWFLPREQESFGTITAIDSCGGITINVIESYRHFNTLRHVAGRATAVYFTHHVYDSVKRQRIYSKQENEHLLSIFRVDADEIEWHLREAHETEQKRKEATRGSARAASRKGF